MAEMFWVDSKNGRNSLFRSAKSFEYQICKEFMFLSRFWGNARRRKRNLDP